VCSVEVGGGEHEALDGVRDKGSTGGGIWWWRGNEPKMTDDRGGGGQGRAEEVRSELDGGEDVTDYSEASTRNNDRGRGVNTISSTFSSNRFFSSEDTRPLYSS